MNKVHFDNLQETYTMKHYQMDLKSIYYQNEDFQKHL